MLRYDRGTLLYTVLLYIGGMVKLCLYTMCYGMIEVSSCTLYDRGTLLYIVLLYSGSMIKLW